jgi:hypothetical protein
MRKVTGQKHKEIIHLLEAIIVLLLAIIHLYLVMNLKQKQIMVLLWVINPKLMPEML